MKITDRFKHYEIQKRKNRKLFDVVLSGITYQTNYKLINFKEQ